MRRNGRPAEAERLCAGLVAAQPDHVPFLNALAMLQADRGAHAEALPLMRRAVALQPKEAALHNNLGSLLYRSGDVPGAEAAYRKAVSLKSDYAEALYNLGIVRAVMGRSEEALAAHRRAVSVNPGYWPAQIQIGALLHARGDNDDALRAFDAVASGAQAFDLHYYRGMVLHALGRHQEAEAAFHRAIAIDPSRFEAHFALAGTLSAIGREEEALQAYKQAVAANPGYLPAHRELNNLAFAMGYDVRGLQSYAFARGKLGEDTDLLLGEAELQLRFDDAEAAETLLRRAGMISGERADVANALGRALMLRGDVDGAEEAFRNAARGEPGNVAHLQELAVLLLRAERAGEAKQALAQALAVNPHDQTSLAYLTLAHRQLGDSEFTGLFDAENFVREIRLPLPAGFSDTASFNRALAEELELLHTRKAAPIDQTVRGGTQTAGALFERDSRPIRLLRDSVREAVADYITSLPSDSSHPFLARRSPSFDFAGSWSCRLQSGGFHTNHIHNEGWLSSAYYAALPEGVGNDGEAALKFGESKFQLGESDRALRTVRPEVGKLVLFPSYFWHGTAPFAAAGSRLAVAFDVVPRPA